MKKKNVIILCIVCFAAAILGFSIPTYKIYAKVKNFDNYIYPGIKIEGENMSGKTTAEAKKLLLKYQTSIENKKININVSGRKYALNYSQINAKYDIDKAVSQAYSYGKNENFVNRYELLKNPQPQEISLPFSYNSNSKSIDELINNIKKDVNRNAKNASITRTGSGFQITPDVDGCKLKDVELKNSIISSINGQIGQDVNISANVEDVKANATSEKLQSINTLISTFSTSYGSISSPERMNNIQLATKAINGLCLMPGETFSFNGVVGERTAQKGYEAAPVDIGNKTSMGLGGGICQVSTTLYNSVLLAGIKPTVRMHHSIPSTYVPLGLDATVDYGNLDYQFKNTLNFPIYIEGSSSNGTEAFSIYSNASLTNKTYKVVNNIDPSGKKVKVYLQTYQNGQMIANDLIATDTYGTSQ